MTPRLAVCRCWGNQDWFTRKVVWVKEEGCDVLCRHFMPDIAAQDSAPRNKNYWTRDCCTVVAWQPALVDPIELHEHA